MQFVRADLYILFLRIPTLKDRHLIFRCNPLYLYKHVALMVQLRYTCISKFFALGRDCDELQKHLQQKIDTQEERFIDSWERMVLF